MTFKQKTDPSGRLSIALVDLKCYYCHQMVTKKEKKSAAKSATPKLSKESNPVRDRLQTRKKILAAVGRLLARKGSKGLGVNAIAREAQVDKVLIYRYFGGLDELYRAFVLEGDSFPSLEELSGETIEKLQTLPPDEAASRALLGFGRAIRRRPITREMMRWELQERNSLTDLLAEERERMTFEWLKLAPKMEGVDLPAVIALLAAGQAFLALRAKTASVYAGIDLHSEEGWQRLENAAALLTKLFFAQAQTEQNPVKRDGGRTKGISRKEQ